MLKSTKRIERGEVGSNRRQDAYLDLLHHYQIFDLFRVLLHKFGNIIRQHDSPHKGHAGIMIFGKVHHRYLPIELISKELRLPQFDVRTLKSEEG